MFFAMMIMFFVFMRVTHGRRRHFAHSRLHRHWPGRHPYFVQLQAQPRSPAPAAPKPSAFEQLKRRYVVGEIDVEQYEDELDVLLRLPEARKDVP
jgi:uncharacterized membrane protein